MSSKVTGWVWDQDLPLQRKCVLLWLAERATDSGVCFPGQAEIRRKTGLSESMVRRYLHGLASDKDEHGQPKPPLVRIIQRPVAGQRHTSNVYVLLVPWADAALVQRELEELKHIPDADLQGLGCTGAPQGSGVHPCAPVGGTGAPQVGVAGDTQEPSLPEPDREYSPLPPRVTSGQQQRGVTNDGECSVPVPGGATPETQLEVPPEPDVRMEQAARAVVEAFYAALGGSAEGVTLAIRRRDHAIARQLVAAGATPVEPQAYAREMAAAPGRIAPVDLRSFERERLGWLARARSLRPACTGLVDRTGQPPSWQIPLDGASPESGGGALPPDERAEHLSGDRVPVTGERLKGLLSHALGGRGR
jgi:hypothetical protein